MSIKKIKISNFKYFKAPFQVEFENDLNILVGKNGEGKSTILEAINLALTGYYHGRSVSRELSPYLFNVDAVKEYIEDIHAGKLDVYPPSILIEVFFDSPNDNPDFEGNHNSEHETQVCGFTFSISFAAEYVDSYNQFLRKSRNTVNSLPLEYYEVKWETFARKYVTPREIKFNSSLIDSSRNTYKSISDVYVSRIIKNTLEENDRITLAQEFRELSSTFAGSFTIQQINKKLNRNESVSITGEQLSLSVDVGSNISWENSLIALANDIPFSYIGKGSQCMLKTELSLLSKEHENASVVLIEEPECHLSHTNLKKLVSHIEAQSRGKQVIISTHSSYVTNRLGLDKVIMISNKATRRLINLSTDTANFFRVLSGYDTLQYILCERAILVEGPSDALIIERAYRDKWGNLPSSKGIDIIEVGTSFLRFLELATTLQINTTIVTDNDGKPEDLYAKFVTYKGNENISLCYENNAVSLPENLKKELGEDFNYNTLEPCLLRSNNIETLCKVLGRKDQSEAILLKYMQSNKTDCALKISASEEKLEYPDYINRAISIQ